MTKEEELKQKLNVLMSQNGLSPLVLYMRLDDAYYKTHGKTLPAGDIYDLYKLDDVIIEKILVLLPALSPDNPTGHILDHLDIKP